VARTLDDQTAAVLVEPIQGEGGVNIPSRDYLPGLRRLCDEHGVLLIVDEVQTGMGRTGQWFAYQQPDGDAEPDILTCAKALAGGIAAGVLIAQPHVAEVLRPGMHAATFGGNPIACRAGLATIETIEEERLLERGTAIGERFSSQFQALRAELPQHIRDIRIRGAMIGLDLTFDATDVVAECMKRRLLINATHGHVVRLLPALTVSNDQIDEGCAILAEVLREVVA
jgi:acetylornithine/succinyldiaminopimelate/putrescine aminotransferase